MDESSLRELIEQIQSGETSADDAVAQLKRLPFTELDNGVNAKIDHHRALRQGLPEAIYGPGKSPEQCVAIVSELLHNGDGPVLITRVSPEQRAALDDAHPDSVSLGNVLTWRSSIREYPRSVAVVTAGTADSPVADECQATLESYGMPVDRINDVGVAGLVIAVPTSVGYGAGLDGVTALLGMLASCAAGISVVGIDNGYGAAVSAMKMIELATP